MACDCEHYINCGGDKKIEIAVTPTEANSSHICNSSLVDNTTGEVLQRTERRFNIEGRWDKTINASYAVGCVEAPAICGIDSSATPSSSVNESCVRESSIPYFVDKQRDIYVFKNTIETFTFGVSSNKTAAFKTTYGTCYFHKLCILEGTLATGTEKFVMIKNGVKKTLAEVSYSYNPFPANSGSGVWGLYGNQVIDPTVKPDTPNVVCILLFPLVPKLASPLDNDVKYYGFYDYNSTEGGFVESSLPADDGGKDYFYPYWCRSMPLDPLWRATADQRYGVIYSYGTSDLHGVHQWSPPQPVVHALPFGSFALNNKEQFIASCILQFSEKASKKGAVYNEANFVDLFESMRNAKLARTGHTAFYPVTPL